MENSLNQYLDLYSQHKDLICGKSAAGFNQLRETAFRNLQATGLPRKGSENYEVADIPQMLAPDFGLNIARIPLDVNVAESFRCGVPHLSTSLFFMLNDRFAESRNARQGLPEGVEIGPLSSALAVSDGLASEFYGKSADLANPLVALNSMLVQEGIFIRVRKGIKVAKPVQLVNILDSAMPLMAMRRVLVVLEEGASLTLISCDHNSSTGQPMASSAVVEIFAGEDSSLDFYDLEESGPDTRRLMSLYLNQRSGSNVVLENFTLHNGSTRNEYVCRFEGEGSSLKLYGMGIETGANMLDNYSFIRHGVPGCHTDELFKYIVEEEARGAFTGRIFVAPGAAKTEAYQSNRNLVTSERARMFSKPQLEIYNDDVKCSHGSATGQLDAMQLFYMRQRGLSEEEALLLLKQAFMEDVVDGIRLPVLRDRLRNLIERRFLGHDLSCGDCDICS